MPALAHQHLSLMAQCERTETPSAQKDIPARRERLRVSELKQRAALNAADGVHTGGRALGWHTVRVSSQRLGDDRSHPEREVGRYLPLLVNRGKTTQNSMQFCFR